MHRQFSLQPFSRHYSHTTHPFLDFLEFGSSESNSSDITVTSTERAQLQRVLADYKEVHKSDTLLTLTFVTVNDYLWLLRAISKELAVAGRHALFYLAAAVSDFFLPRQKMVSSKDTKLMISYLITLLQSEHKIQSGKGSLHIEMDQVPKILKPLVDEWTREGFIVSFKVSFVLSSASSSAKLGHVYSSKQTPPYLYPRLKLL